MILGLFFFTYLEKIVLDFPALWRIMVVWNALSEGVLEHSLAIVACYDLRMALCVNRTAPPTADADAF